MSAIYLETSFISSYVTDRMDAASVYRRQTAREWWSSQKSRHEVWISEEVLTELSHPSFTRSAAALELTQDVPLLPMTDDVRGLARLLVREKVMPGPVAGDAVHVALATVHGIDYLLTWNVRHLANPNKVEHLQKVCMRVGLAPPRIVTPDLLWEVDDAPL